MKNHRPIFLLTCCVCIASALLWLVVQWSWTLGGHGPASDGATLHFTPQAEGQSAVGKPQAESKKAGFEDMFLALEKCWKRLGPGMTPDQAQKALDDLTTLLWSGDPSQVGAAIRKFLDSGRDAVTGLPFRVGEEGLAHSPSLRVALLDLLERLDFGEALEYAEIIVGRMDNPDETAVALRTLMRAPDDDQRHQLAHTGVDRLLQRADWKKQPTGGYLEAFDIATETENPITWKRVLALTSDEDAFEGTQAAAGLAAHTLAVRSPEFRQLIARRDDSTVMSPIIRGQLMARLDPRIPEELAALNTFVTNPAMTQEEAQAFTANFPSQRDLVGFRLVSDSLSAVRPLESAAKLDIAASEFMRQLSTTEVVPQLRPLMVDFSKRLLQFAESAQNAR